MAIERVGVVGAGTMGQGIAMSFANAGFPVTVVETVDLIENGRNVLVTQENKQEYVRLMVEFKLTGSVQDQLDNFLKGKSHREVYYKLGDLMNI